MSSDNYMGSCVCFNSRSKSIVPDSDQPSLNTLQKNKLKIKVFANKIETAPKLKLESNNLYAKRKPKI